MVLWRAERFSFLEEVTAFLNLRQLTSSQFKIIVASDNVQRPYVVFVQEDEQAEAGPLETAVEAAEPVTNGAIEVAEAIVADAQREEE